MTIHLNHVLFNVINAIVNSAAYETQIFRELRFVFLRKHSHLEKRQKIKNKKQAHTHVYGVVSKNNVDYTKGFYCLHIMKY